MLGPCWMWWDGDSEGPSPATSSLPVRYPSLHGVDRNPIYVSGTSTRTNLSGTDLIKESP